MPKPRVAASATVNAAPSGTNGASARTTGAISAPCRPFVKRRPNGSAKIAMITARIDPITSTGPMPARIEWRISAVLPRTRNLGIVLTNPTSDPHWANVPRRLNNATDTKKIPVCVAPSPLVTIRTSRKLKTLLVTTPTRLRAPPRATVARSPLAATLASSPRDSGVVGSDVPTALTSPTANVRSR